MGIIIDLSSNNAHPIDYAAAKASGVIAAIIKATDGTGYTNPYYAQDAAGFEAVGVPVLGYHFAEFGNAQAEAAYFVSVAGARARVLDSETNSDVAWQNAFLTALNLPGNEEMDYGSASSLPQSGIRSLLWPASYGRNYGFGDCWQYSETQSVPGIQGNVDASVWIGSQADFDSLFSVSSPTPSIEGSVYMIPSGCTDQGAIAAQAREWWATIRSDPMTAGDQNFLIYFFNLPANQTAWGVAGWGGNPDSMLAWIIDNGSSTGHLRPQFAGAV